MTRLARLYLNVDPRTLALTRVVIGVVLLADLLKRWAGLDVWYADDGLLPVAVVRGMNPDGLSVFWYIASEGALHAAFAGCAAVYLALLLGVFTPVAHALALGCIVSLQARVQLLSSGGDYVLCIVLWWTLLLPLGRCFGFDAWRRNRRSGFRGVDAITTVDTTPVTSVAVLGATFNLAAIYLFNTLHKDGATWMEGTAIHYTLWLDRVVTPLAVWYRGFLSPLGSTILTYATLATEGSLPLLILSPIGRPWTRRVAVLLIVGLHSSISMMLNVGIFSVAMMTFGTLLVSREDWEALARLRSRFRRGPARGSAPPEAAPFAPARSGAVSVPREVAAAALLALVVVVLLNDNWAVPRWLKPRAPSAVVRFVNVAQLTQRWTMFAPDVGVDEMALVVRGITAEGMAVDPVNDTRSFDNQWLRVVPERTDQNVYWHHYALRATPVAALHPALTRWIFSHHERTGREDDRIDRFVAFVVSRRSPDPGQDFAYAPVERELLRAERPH